MANDFEKLRMQHRFSVTIRPDRGWSWIDLQQLTNEVKAHVLLQEGRFLPQAHRKTKLETVGVSQHPSGGRWDSVRRAEKKVKPPFHRPPQIILLNVPQYTRRKPLT